MITMLVTLCAGLVAGILSGLLGVGGGLILIPIMIFLLGMSQHTAQGISLLVIIPTAMTGLWHLHKAKLINYHLAMYLALGSIIGALVSANFVQYIPAQRLKLIFGCFVIFMGAKTLWGTLKSK